MYSSLDQNFLEVYDECQSPFSAIYIVVKCYKSVQSRDEVYMLKACDACADMGQL